MKRAILLIVAGCVALLATPSWACSVPVYRYALERWWPDPYEVIVFHRGELTEKEQTILNDLTPEGLAGEKRANVRLHQVDLDAEPIEEQLKMWEAQKTETLPWMVVKYPLPTRNPANVWAGPLSEKITKQLLMSPMRQEVARLLLKGKSAVWVFLKGGDEQQDAAAFKLVKDRLAHLEKELAPPEVSEEDVKQGLIDIDPDELKLSFALLPLSRKDPKEKLFVDMLLGSEEDLKNEEYAKQPMVFPIFGRGRALWAYVGEGIDNDNIDEACIFLSGPCSCQVKSLNPGTDLLIAVDWEALLDPTIEVDESLPPLVGLAAFTTESPSGKVAETETVETQPEAQTGPEPEPKQLPGVSGNIGTADAGGPAGVSGGKFSVSPVLRNVLLVAGAGVIGVLLASFLMISRKQP